MILYFLVGAVALIVCLLFLRQNLSPSSTASTNGLAEPPRVPAWLPFVGNALDFGRDSQGYLQRCQAAYGDAFRLKMMGQDYVFVLDPFSFPNVFREEKKNLSFIAIVKEFACKCFGASEVEFEKQNHETVHKQFITYLQGMELPALTARMREHLERAIREKTQPVLLANSATEWQDGRMWQFVMEVLYVAGTRAFFGDTFDVEQSFKDFFDFDDNFPAFTIGVPDVLLGKSVRARQRMNDLLVHLTDPTASKLMVERERYLVEETTIPPKQLSRLQFATFWAAHGNTIPAAFWSLAYILSDKRAKQEITEEVFSLFHKRDTGRETFAKLKDMVKLDSAINEALRLSSASIIVREVMNDFTLKMQSGDQFHIRRGQKVAMYPYIIHNNPEVYDNPKVYRFDRFLPDEESEDEEDYSHLKFAPSAKVPGTMERVESADVLHLKHRELRQLRESRRRERDVRDSRVVHTTAAAADSELAASAATAVDNNAMNESPLDGGDLRESSRQKVMKDLRESGRFFARILGDSGHATTTDGSSSGGEEREGEWSSPQKLPAITLSEKLRQKESEEDTAVQAKEQEQEAGGGGGGGSEADETSGQGLRRRPGLPMTPTSKRSLDRRFQGPPTLQEQLSSSGEVDLASPLFLRRAQRMTRKYEPEPDESDGDDEDDGGGHNTNGGSGNGSSDKKPAEKTTTTPPMIQINEFVEFSADEKNEKKEESAASDRQAGEEREASVDRPVPPIKLGSGLRRSKQLLQVAALNRRDRSVSLGVIPQLAIPTTAADGAQPAAQAQSGADASAAAATGSGAGEATNIPGDVPIEALAFQSTATSASPAIAGLASPRISREQHLMFKKRERTGSFNIPGDPRLQQRKEKKFYYQGRELRYHLMPFGGGAGMCPGRFFARNELKLFVAVMIYYFDLELVPNEQGEIKLPSLDETRLGIGILPPAKDLPFRFRLREEHLADFGAAGAPQQQ